MQPTIAPAISPQLFGRGNVDGTTGEAVGSDGPAGGAAGVGDTRGAATGSRGAGDSGGFVGSEGSGSASLTVNSPGIPLTSTA